MTEKPIEKATEEINKEKLIAVLGELASCLHEDNQRLERLEKLYPGKLPEIKEPFVKFMFDI